MKNFFTSDHHFGHFRIIELCGRPFKTNEEQTETLIRNWNSVVGPTDLVHHLGDVIFKTDDLSILKRLNGSIKFVYGNHDKTLKRYFANGDFIRLPNGQFHERLEAETEISIEGQRIILGHYALAAWNKKRHGSWMLCGHSHYNLPLARKDNNSLGKILDVGIDGNNYFPYSFEEIRRIMDKKPIDGVLKELSDHHIESNIEDG